MISSSRIIRDLRTKIRKTRDVTTSNSNCRVSQNYKKTLSYLMDNQTIVDLFGALRLQWSKQTCFSPTIFKMENFVDISSDLVHLKLVLKCGPSPRSKFLRWDVRWTCTEKWSIGRTFISSRAAEKAVSWLTNIRILTLATVFLFKTETLHKVQKIPKRVPAT